MPRYPKKAKKELVSPEFKDMVEAASPSELKEKIVNLSKNEGEVIKQKNSDEALQEAKEKVKEYSAPYSEALKVVRSQRTYVHEILEQRGQ